MQKGADSIPGLSDFMVRRSTLIDQEINHTSLYSSLLASIFNAGRAHFTLRSPPEQ